MSTKGSIRRTIALLASAATVVTLATIVGSPAQAETVLPVDPAAPADASVISSTPIVSLGAPTDADYWTPERMAAAIPADKPTASHQKSALQGAAVVPQRNAKATVINPAYGSLASRVEPLAARVTRPYTNLPDRLNGKVFFTEDGNSYVCSGTVVNSNNKDMIDTAGHCVSDGYGTFHSHWIFVPGYASTSSGGTVGRYPYGKWSARQLTTMTAWHYYGDLKEDYGYGVLNKLGGKHIVDLLGGNGIKFNQSHDQTWTTFGYPQATPFNGFDQRAVVSARVKGGNDDPAPGWVGPDTVSIVSNLTPGCSGGGWIVNRSSKTGIGYVNGHNSYRYAGGPKASPRKMYGPYFGADALGLYLYTRSL